MPANTRGHAETKECNQLGLDFRAEARQFPYAGPIWDVHTHLFTPEAAKVYFQVADAFGIERVWSMTQLERVDEVKAVGGDRVQFIAVPNHEARNEPGTFTTDWLKRIEQFAAKGVKICKFFAAPRVFDFHPGPWLTDQARGQAMDLARSLGMMFMTHVADPDVWFATRYADSRKYGTKNEHYTAFEKRLDEYDDVTWLAAHMGGWPENLEFLQGLLDRHPHLYLDTSATKWMTRELSHHPDEFADFARRNAGRLLFGSDIVAHDENIDFDLYASRYWALRTVMETPYIGQSPIVDPDVAAAKGTEEENPTATLRGAKLDHATLKSLYHDAAERVLMPLYR
jgi:predicted TIM-barrel fold metal-dependent hydrolase